MRRRRLVLIALLGIGAAALAAPVGAAPDAPVMLAPGEQPPSDDPPAPNPEGGLWPATSDVVGITNDRCPNWNSVKTVRSGFKITTDGAVLENYDVSGTVQVDAKNVTLRCFRVTGGRYGIQCGLSGATGCKSLVVEDSEIREASSSGVLFFGGGTSSAPSVLRRSYLHHNTDNLKITSSYNLIEDNYMHDIRDATGDCHCDGVQYRAGSNNVVRRNYLSGRKASNSPYGANQNGTSAMINQAADGDIDRFTLEDNLIHGGGFGIYLTKKNTCSTCTMTNVHVRRNTFADGSFAWGPFTSNVGWSGACLVWQGNRSLSGNSLGGPGGARSSGSCF